MVDQIIDEDSQTALPNDESASKPEGSEKESTQVWYPVIKLTNSKSQDQRIVNNYCISLF